MKKQNEMDYAAIVTADEMQDRDAWLAPVLQSLRQPPASGRRTAAIEAVSYTHLTLPTIYSV